MGEWGYSSIYSLSEHKIQVTAMPLSKEPTLSIQWQTGWAARPRWILGGKKNPFFVGNQTKILWFARYWLLYPACHFLRTTCQVPVGTAEDVLTWRFLPRCKKTFGKVEGLTWPSFSTSAESSRLCRRMSQPTYN